MRVYDYAQVAHTCLYYPTIRTITLTSQEGT